MGADNYTTDVYCINCGGDVLAKRLQKIEYLDH